MTCRYKAHTVCITGPSTEPTAEIELGPTAALLLGSENSIRLTEEEVDELIVDYSDDREYAALSQLALAATLLDGHSVLVVERVFYE